MTEEYLQKVFLCLIQMAVIRKSSLTSDDEGTRPSSVGSEGEWRDKK